MRLKKLFIILLLSLLFCGNAHAQAMFRPCDKEGDCLDINSDGTISANGIYQKYIDPSQDLGTVIDTIEASGVATQLNLAPGTYNECDIDITAPVKLSIKGSGVSNTTIYCADTASQNVIDITGQDANSKLSFHDFFIDINLTGDFTAKGIEIIQSSTNQTLTNEQVDFRNIKISANSTLGHVTALYTEDIGYEASNIDLYCTSSGNSRDVKCLWSLATSGMDLSFETNLYDSKVISGTGSDNSSFSGRAISYYMNNTNHSGYTWTANTYNTYAYAFQYANSGGERLGCYCVNDDTATNGILNCNYYNGSCGSTSRAVRTTATSNAAVNANYTGTQFYGTNYIPDLVQSGGSLTTRRYNNVIPVLSLYNSATQIATPTSSTNSVTLLGTPLMSLVGQPGGINNGTTSGTGGEGADVTITAGIGGTASGASGASVGGSGGDFTLTAGDGAAEVNAGTTNSGGAGGTISLIGGDGGVANSGSSTQTGGIGGDQYYAAGVGGVGTDITGRDGVIVVGGTGTTTSQGHVDLILKTKVIAADDTTPDVRYSSHHITSANTGATAITDLDNPTVGKMVCLTGGSATNSSTIADSGNFNLTAAMTLGLDDVICLYVQADNDYIEMFRSNN